MPIDGYSVVNWAYFLGDGLVLRVNKPDVGADDCYTERVAVPAARLAGVQTPELLVFDDGFADVPNVFTVYERAPGVSLNKTTPDLDRLDATYRQLGAEVARWQLGVTRVDDPNGWLDVPEAADPWAELESARKAATVDGVAGAWISRWLRKLEPGVGLAPTVFTHNDLHAANTMVDPSTLALTGVIDWGDAGWGDPVSDFEAVPLWAVPAMSQGFREAGGATDDGFVPRLLWSAVGSALEWSGRDEHRGPEPWAPLPTSLWANLARFLSMPLDDEWRDWLP